MAFLRFVNACGRIHCSFVMGKARVAPIHEITIPRLELTPAVISVKLSQIIREELETKIDQVNYWTDSMTVLNASITTRSAFMYLSQSALLSSKHIVSLRVEIR